jgi:hypothetical protein
LFKQPLSLTNPTINHFHLTNPSFNHPIKMQFTLSAFVLVLAASATALSTNQASGIERRQSGNLPEGSPCAANECQLGLTCVFRSGQPICSRNLGSGAFCIQDNDCASGNCDLGDNGSFGAVAFQCV